MPNAKLVSQLEQMLTTQNELNKLTIGFTWIVDPPDLGLAIFMEAAEGVDKFPWKWWHKGAEAQVEAAKIELIDILHFALSLDIINNDNIMPYKKMADTYANQYEHKNVMLKLGHKRFRLEEMDTVELFALLGGLGLQDQVDFRVIYELMKRLEMTFTDLFSLYMKKVLLNTFRQKNGYKTGSYVKIWGQGEKKNNLEDNDYLQGFSKELDWSDPAAPKLLYSYLEEVYAKVPKPVKPLTPPVSPTTTAPIKP